MKGLLLIALAVSAWFCFYSVTELRSEIRYYRNALDRINNDMQINYALQENTSAQLKDCRVQLLQNR